MNEIPIYRTPDNTRIYAIGDLHGYVDLLDQMHESIFADLEQVAVQDIHIVYLGDYVDRGPDSRGVIERLIDMRDRKDGITRHFLKGNHENGMFEFFHDPVADNWLKWGGVQTLKSYGIHFSERSSFAICDAEKKDAAQAMRSQISPSHFDFFDCLNTSVSLGDYFFAHAGVDPFKPFDRQTEDDLTRIRQPFLSWHETNLYKPFPKKVVHGHSISKEPVIRPHRIGIDTGAYEQGILSAVVLEGEDVRFLQVGDV